MSSRRSSSSSALRLSTARRSQLVLARGARRARGGARRSRRSRRRPSTRAATSRARRLASSATCTTSRAGAQPFECGRTPRRAAARHAGGRERRDARAPALALGGGQRALARPRAASRKRSTIGLERSDARVGREQPADGALDAATSGVESSATSPSGPASPARAASAWASVERLDDDERARDLGGASRRSRAPCG